MTHTPGKRRPGLSRVEVLVIALIVLVALGALIPGVRWWRESADRLHCENNLKIQGETIFEYNKAHKQLPASCIDKGYATWAVQISPYLPEPGAKDLSKWDLAKTYYRQSAAVRQAQVVWYYCPARRKPPQESRAGDVPAGEPKDRNYAGALGDYAACAGDGAADAPWDTSEANGALIIGKVLKREGDRIVRWTGRIRLTDKDLPRGKQYTILLGEKHVPLGEWGLVASGDGSLYNGDHFGSFARVAGPGFGLAQAITDPYQRNFGSYHPRICQFLFADGSVKAFTITTDEKLLGKLANRLQRD
jgi:hypothetical protein